MAIPTVDSPVWKDLLLKRKTYDFEFLALKMLLGRLTLEVERDQSEANIAKCAGQLHDLLEKNGHLPTAVSDIQKLGS